MNRVPKILAAVALAIAALGLACCQKQPAREVRLATWAAPLAQPPLSNFFLVAPNIYRGAQPDSAGMAELEKMGVRTVLNLRGLHSDGGELEKTGLAYRHITFQTWHPETEDVVEFLRIVTKPANQPVFIHCKHGSDRTGMMCAIYRMAVQGWPRDEAIREMTEGGFGFHPIWTNLIDYLKKVDVERIRFQAGL